MSALDATVLLDFQLFVLMRDELLILVGVMVQVAVHHHDRRAPVVKLRLVYLVARHL